MKVFCQYIFILTIASVLFTSCEKEDPYTPPNSPKAMAGNSLSIKLPVNSIDVTGSGTSDGGTIVGYLWSLISGPNVPVITSPASPSTSIKGLIAGKYTFQFMVIDDQGLTGVDTLIVQVIPSVEMTLTLQPANNMNEMHMLGILSGTGNAMVNTPEIGATFWTIGGVASSMRAVLKFDLSSLPSNAVISSAKLTLYSNPTPLNGNHSTANAGTDNTMYIERITSAWSSSTLTWTNQPTSSSADRVIAPSTTLPFLDLTDLNVTNQVKEMVVSNKNYGFFLRLKQEVLYTSRVFCSSKYPDAKKHPKLVVVYKLQ